MNKKMKKVVTILFVLLVSIPISAQTYDFVAIQNLASQEIAAELGKSIFKEAGFELTVTPLPGDRAISWSTTGKKDGEVLRIKQFGEIHTTLIRVPTPIYSVSTSAFTLKGSNIKIESVDDLKNYTVAIIKGVKNTKDMVKGLNNVIELDDGVSLIKFLKAGRADVILHGSFGARSTAAKLSVDIEEVVLSSFPLYMYFHESHKDVVPKIDAVIQKRVNSGELAKEREELERKYF